MKIFRLQGFWLGSIFGPRSRSDPRLLPAKLYIIVLSFLAVCLGGSYFSLIKENRHRARFSCEAQATITRTDVRRDVDPETGKEFSKDVLVTFEYEIDRNKYTRTERKSKVESLGFVPWGNAKVCYDPNDRKTHEKALLTPANQKCG